MEKLMKARKDHICSYCGRAIKKGELYTFGTGRSPRYEINGFNEKQVGIKYCQYHLCGDPDQCINLEDRAAEIE